MEWWLRLLEADNERDMVSLEFKQGDGILITFHHFKEVRGSPIYCLLKVIVPWEEVLCVSECSSNQHCCVACTYIAYVHLMGGAYGRTGKKRAQIWCFFFVFSRKLPTRVTSLAVKVMYLTYWNILQNTVHFSYFWELNLNLHQDLSKCTVCKNVFPIQQYQNVHHMVMVVLYRLHASRIVVLSVSWPHSELYYVLWSAASEI